MYNETNVPGPEYRVRAVTRFVVTRYFHGYQRSDSLDIKDFVPGSSEVIAEVPNEGQAMEIAKAMAFASSDIGATVQE